MSAETPAPHNADIFLALESHPWQHDPDFQSGLQAILSSNGIATPNTRDSQTQDVMLRARCFYFARKHGLPASIDPEAYSAWRAQQPSSALVDLHAVDVSRDPLDGHGEQQPALPLDGHGSEAPTPGPGEPASSTGQQEQAPSFQEVMELIQSGKSVPGIREIPDTVLLGQGSNPVKGRRQKPWERAQGGQSGSPFSLQELQDAGS